MAAEDLEQLDALPDTGFFIVRKNNKTGVEYKLPVATARDVIGGATGGGGVDLNAVNTFLRNGVTLAPGASMAFDTTNPNSIVFNNTTAYHGETNFVGVSFDDPTDTVTIIVDPVFKLRVATLEAARSLIQSKDAVATGGATNSMLFPGTAGNYITSPTNAAYDVTGDTSWVVRVKMPASAPGADVCLASRRGATAANCQFSLFIKPTGQLSLGLSVNGSTFTAPTTTAAVPLVFDGNWIWLRFSRTASTGNCNFYTAADTGANGPVPTVWTTFQTNKGSTIGDLYVSSVAPVEISGYAAGTSSMFSGQIGRVAMYNAFLPGTNMLFDINASDYVSGSSWVSNTKTWTIVGTASVTVAGESISNTSAEFSLNESDAFPTLGLSIHDTVSFQAEATLTNTSGGAVNYTPRIKVGGSELFTFSPISIPAAAATVYGVGCAVKLGINAVDGTTAIARAQLIVANGVTGTDLGSAVMASHLVNLSGQRYCAPGVLPALTSIPGIQLLMTMASAASTISARPHRTQVYVSKG